MIDTKEKPINIRELTIPEPIEKDPSFFDPRKDISSSEWNNIEAYIITRIHHPPGLDEYRRSVESIYQYCLLDPEKAARLIPDYYVKQLEKSLARVDLDEELLMALKKAVIIKNVGTAHDTIDFSPAQWSAWSDEFNLGGTTSHHKLHAARLVRMLYSEKQGVFSPTNSEWRRDMEDLKRDIVTADSPEVPLWAYHAADIHMYHPSRFNREVSVTNDMWKIMIDKLHPVIHHPDGFLSYAFSMAHVAATGMQMTPQGLILVYPEIPSRKPVKDPLPEVRKF